MSDQRNAFNDKINMLSRVKNNFKKVSVVMNCDKKWRQKNAQGKRKSPTETTSFKFVASVAQTLTTTIKQASRSLSEKHTKPPHDPTRLSAKRFKDVVCAVWRLRLLKHINGNFAS